MAGSTRRSTDGGKRSEQCSKGCAANTKAKCLGCIGNASQERCQRSVRAPDIPALPALLFIHIAVGPTYSSSPGYLLADFWRYRITPYEGSDKRRNLAASSNCKHSVRRSMFHSLQIHAGNLRRGSLAVSHGLAPTGSDLSQVATFNTNHYFPYLAITLYFHITFMSDEI